MRVDPYSTHLPFLAWAILHTDGPILELGAGPYSTPLIHVLAGNRRVLSLEQDPQYVRALQDLVSATHRIDLVTSWDLPLLDDKWAVALVDNAASMRAPCLRRLKETTEIIVIHDTNKADYYGLCEPIAEFKHVVECSWFEQETTVVSMTRPLGDLRKLTEAT